MPAKTDIIPRAVLDRPARLSINAGLRDISDFGNDPRLIEAFLLARAKNPRTRRVYEVALAQLVNWHKGHELRNMSVMSALQFENSLSKRLKPASVRHYVAVASSLFTFGVRSGYFHINPFAVDRKTNPPEPPYRRLEKDETLAIIRHAPTDRYKRLFELLYVSGARMREALMLTWADLEEDGGHVALNLMGKGNKRRTVRLNKGFSRKLMAMREHAADDARVFAVSDTAVRAAMTRAAQRAGVTKPVSPHWFRHAHGSHAMDNGEPAHVVQETLGHKSLDTTTRYAKPKPKRSSSEAIDTSEIE